jgi:hypothetical protein
LLVQPQQLSLMKPSPKNKTLTVQIARSRLQDYLDTSDFTAIEDDAARVLSTLEEESISLDGLVGLSVPAAEALAKFKGEYISLDGITDLAPLAAASLAQYRGENLSLGGLQLRAEISTQIAEYKGHLSLGNTSVDLALIETFYAYKGTVWIGAVTHLGDEEAGKLAALISNGKVTSYLGAVREFTDCDGHLALLSALVKECQNGRIFLGGVERLAPRALKLLSEFEGADLVVDPSLRKQLVKIKRKNTADLIKRGHLEEPREWKSGRILLAAPPLKPLKGRNHERCEPKELSWWLPKKVSEWFLQHLDESHKTSVGNGYGAPKNAHISPEAGRLLVEKAVVWTWLCERQEVEAKTQTASLLARENQPEVPRELQNDRVVLPPPFASVSAVYCWKPDFEGENYQAVLSYYSYLPEEHKGTVQDEQGYPAKVMSPEAAELYRKHRVYWETQHASARASAQSEKSERSKRASDRVKQAAATAGLSLKELETKFDRLSDLVEQGNLQLVSDMIAGFGEVWLYESLLAGSRIDESGELHPGKQLKRFKKHAKTLMLLV